MSTTPSELSALESVLEQLPTPLLLIEPGSGRVLFANRAAGRLAEGAIAAAQAVDGERAAGVMVDWRAPSGVRTMLVSSSVIDVGRHGAVVVRTMEDVTEIEAERRRSASLADATAALAASLDFETTLQTLARELVPRMADWCFVELVAGDGSIERTVIEAADPDKLALALEYDERFPLDPDAPVGSPAVIRTGRPELVPEIPPGLLEAVAQSEDHLRVLRGIAFQSSLVVPLRVAGEVVGDIALAQSESGRRFTEDDLRAAEDLAARCSLFLENARLYERLREAGVAERAARQEVEAILEGMGDAVFAQTPSGEIVYINQAGVEMFGFETADDVLAEPIQSVRERFALLDAERRPIAREDLPGRRALAGETPDAMIVLWTPAAGGPERWARLKSAPLRGDDGAVRLAITVMQDITEIKEAEFRYGFLAEASRLLASSLDYQRTLARVAELAVPAIADWCVVDLATDDDSERVALRHKDPARLALAEELTRRYPPDRATSAVLRVIRTGRSELYSEIPGELLAATARDEEHLRLMRAVGMVSAMVVPMKVRDHVLGAITLVTAESRRRFSEGHLALAEDLGLRAAIAVENARLYSQRSAIASTLQSSLLPPELPEVDRLACAAHFQAAGEAYDVGGDFYDLFSTADDEWIAVIGDVCGKGAEAAATTALVRHTIRAAAARHLSPAEVLRRLNEAMLRDEGGAAGRFCTVAVVRIDTSGGPGAVRLTAASGGHPLPRIVRDGVAEPVGAPGTLIGVTPDVVFEEGAATLAPGEALVLFTDGLTEARAPARVWSPADVDTALGQARAASGGDVQRMVDQLAAAALGDLEAAPRDDVAVLAVQVKEG